MDAAAGELGRENWGHSTLIFRRLRRGRSLGRERSEIAEFRQEET